MKLIKTYKYKLKLSKNQSALIDNWIGTCRFIYNLALETKITAYKSGVSLSKYDLMKQLVELKDIDWIKSVPSQTLQDVIDRLDLTYQNFFKGGGFPKWAKKGEYNSIKFKSINKISDYVFNIPKIGNVTIFKDRIISGELKNATIIKENNAYYICIAVGVESKNMYPVNDNQIIGLDMGISYFLVDSNGNYIENPRTTKKYERILRIKSRSLSRKKKGGAGFLKTKKELNNLHLKIANTRTDFLHKISFQYVKNNSLIVCEDLKVNNMIKFGNLSKHIADVSWSNFFSMLNYKSLFYEKDFIKINPKYTSQKCNHCGFIAKENRISQSKFKCIKCGHEDNADLNASKNILGEGIAFKRQREAVACA